MKNIVYHLDDKTEWGPGPWQDEPDKMQWLDDATGLPCLIVRNHFGSLCGYVGVSKGHPAYKKGYDDVDVDVHGGLTFAGKCGERICHLVEDGEDDDVWWLGFDCGHCFDLAPGIRATLAKMNPPNKLYEDRDAVYRDVAYVRSECERLAKQLKALAP